MNPKIQDLIKSCNDCIVSCESGIKSCKNCIKFCKNQACSTDIAQDCSVNCQKIINTCQLCMHKCNQALEHKLYKSPKQELALKNCIEACKESIKRCQTSTQKILDKDTLLGCNWPVDSLNKCISACDECIESFENE